MGPETLSQFLNFFWSYLPTKNKASRFTGRTPPLTRQSDRAWIIRAASASSLTSPPQTPEGASARSRPCQSPGRTWPCRPRPQAPAHGGGSSSTPRPVARPLPAPSLPGSALPSSLTSSASGPGLRLRLRSGAEVRARLGQIPESGGRCSQWATSLPSGWKAGPARVLG